MNTRIKIGILSPSNIALRRFLPALKNCACFEYVGVAVATAEERSMFDSAESNVDNGKHKAKHIQEVFGGAIFLSYLSMLESDCIQAVYIPLPPALHAYWSEIALKLGKHVLVEKPSTTNFSDTQKITKVAKENSLTLHENYMFLYHNQISLLDEILASQRLGRIRAIRMMFGFPFRGSNDFRYKADLGGGALLDCGGYPIRLGWHLLGDMVNIKFAHLQYDPEYEVDIGGTVCMQNANGLTAFIAFGMDNSYKCELEIWGSHANLYTNRIFTAGRDFKPTFWIKDAAESKTIQLEPHDSFEESLQYFYLGIVDPKIRHEAMRQMLKQSSLIQDVLEKGKK